MGVTADAAEPKVFGFRMSPATSAEVADAVVSRRRAPAEGVGLIVTPNIHHITMLRTDREFVAAYESAEVITCDGFPVYYYAHWRHSAAPGRVTGCDIVADIFRHPGLTDGHRLFFVLDHPTTESAVHAWAALHGLSAAIETTIPPLGFERDAAFCLALAERIHAHATTILFMGVGAPKSEIFVNRQRASLPPCWALCIGQAVKIELGMTVKPPKIVQTINLEWLWRIMLEPRRLTGRYATAAVGFLLAIRDDLRRAAGGTG